MRQETKKMLRSVINDPGDREKIYAITAHFFLICAAPLNIELMSRDIRNGILDRNQDGFDLLDLSCLLYSLTIITSTIIMTYGVATKLSSISQQLHFSVSKKIRHEKEKQYANLYDTFQDLSTASKIILWKKNLAEQDDIGKIDLKYICPISQMLIIDPVFLLIAPKDFEQRLAELCVDKTETEAAKIRKNEYKSLAKLYPVELMEIYDAYSIKQWYGINKNSLISVKTQRPILDNEGLYSYQLTKEHGAYIKKLAATLKLLAAKENKVDNKRNACGLM